MKNIVLFLLLYIYITPLLAQQPVEKEIDSILNSDFIILSGDSASVNLREIQILKKLKFTTNKERHYYLWFRRKVHNAYPYAKIATQKYTSLMKRLKKIKSPRRKKRYTKRVQKYLEKKFTEPLKKLTRTEGRILIKLIHRQTGRTAYDIVKEVRSGWKAFWYNTTASMFDLSLKDKYNPATVKEDFMIEDILQRAFNDATLEFMQPKKEIDYFKLASHWRKKSKTH